MGARAPSALACVLSISTRPQQRGGRDDLYRLGDGIAPTRLVIDDAQPKNTSNTSPVTDQLVRNSVLADVENPETIHSSRVLRGKSHSPVDFCGRLRFPVATVTEINISPGTQYQRDIIVCPISDLVRGTEFFQRVLKVRMVAQPLKPLEATK